jgi:hypothetical protein
VVKMAGTRLNILQRQTRLGLYLHPTFMLMLFYRLKMSVGVDGQRPRAWTAVTLLLTSRDADVCVALHPSNGPTPLQGALPRKVKTGKAVSVLS